MGSVCRDFGRAVRGLQGGGGGNAFVAFREGQDKDSGKRGRVTQTVEKLAQGRRRTYCKEERPLPGRARGRDDEAQTHGGRGRNKETNRDFSTSYFPSFLGVDTSLLVFIIILK